MNEQFQSMILQNMQQFYDDNASIDSAFRAGTLSKLIHDMNPGNEAKDSETDDSEQPSDSSEQGDS